MDKKERAALIRKGNEHFNKGEINAAMKIFIRTDYKDGLIRLGDYYYYDKKQPLLAFKFYKKANMHEKVNEIFTRMIYALSKWIGEDKLKEDLTAKQDSTFQISPKLKKAAEEIIKKNKA